MTSRRAPTLIRLTRAAWLLPTVLALAAQPAAWAQAPAGVTAAVNPQATGTPPAELPRVLEIGGEVVQNEHITTGPEGQAQLLFRDGSTMTLGPGGDLTIDNFVYDPDAKTAKLAMTAATGLFRFVGGAASKDEPVVIHTPTATVGIRGGISFFIVEPDGKIEVTKAHGKEITATSTATGETTTVTKDGFTITVESNGAVKVSATDPGRLTKLISALKGRPGATGGATTSPNQNSSEARRFASSNSGQTPLGFIPGTLGTSNAFASVAGTISQLVSYSAQTLAVDNGAGLTSSGGIPTLTSGSYSASFASAAFFNSASGGTNGIGSGGVPFPTLSYSFTQSGMTTTVTTSSDINATLVNGIPQTLTSTNAFNFSSPSSSPVSFVQTIVSTLAGAAVAERYGDRIVQIGRLTGGTQTITQMSTLIANGMTFNSPSTTTTFPLSAAQSTNYAIGVPASLLPSAGTFNFSLLAATAPTFTDGSGLPGKFTGSLNIMFGFNPAQLSLSQAGFSGNVSGFLVALDGTVTMPNDASYRLTTLGGLSNLGAQLAAIQSGASTGFIVSSIAQTGASFSGNPNVTVSGISRICPGGSGTCGAYVLGFLAGPGGLRAAILYSIGNLAMTPGIPQILGAAAFKR